MEELFCWRCQEVVPMMDEQEFEVVWQVLQECLACKDIPISKRFAPVSAKYAEISGLEGVHHNVLIHHRISLYGPPCVVCNKPLRTSKASICAACGHTVDRC